MKDLSRILVITVALMMPFSVSSQKLGLRSQPVDIAKTVWDFSQTEDATVCPVYRVYGDSLLTEYYDGVRQWYGLTPDSTYYLGEESRRYKMTPDHPIPTSAFGHSLLQTYGEERAQGLYCKTFAIGTEGTYESSYPVDGEMILSPGITIKAKAVTEKRIVTTSVLSDSLAPIVLQTKEVTRTRWFPDGSFLPMALQITESAISDGKQMSSATVTFISRFSESVPNESERLQKALYSAEISISNSVVSIYSEFKEPVDLTLYVSALTGGVFHQQSLSIPDGNSHTELRLPSLPPGKYILTVSAGTPTDRKIAFST